MGLISPSHNTCTDLDVLEQLGQVAYRHVSFLCVVAVDRGLHCVQQVVHPLLYSSAHQEPVHVSRPENRFFFGLKETIQTEQS